jgi:hypothetical protein
MSDPALHEITFNRAKEEPVPASFSGVVLFFYQNDLWSASTKIRPVTVPQMTLICPWPLNLPRVSVVRVIYMIALLNPPARAK